MKRKLRAVLCELGALLAIAAFFCALFIVLSLLVHGRLNW